MLWQYESSGQTEGKFSRRKTLGILAVTALVIGGLFSLAASALPDGLEWSMEKVAGSAELTAAGEAYETAAKIQDTTAL